VFKANSETEDNMKVVRLKEGMRITKCELLKVSDKVYKYRFLDKSGTEFIAFSVMWPTASAVGKVMPLEDEELCYV
jgi:hypothetical protein